MEIKKENLLAVLKTAPGNVKEILLGLFPEVKEEQARPVQERINTFDDAVKELGEKHPFVIAYKDLLRIMTREDYLVELVGYDVVAYLKLRIICAALNEGWEPKFKRDELRWYPWFNLYAKKQPSNRREERKVVDGLKSLDDRFPSEYDRLCCSGPHHAPSYSAAAIGSRLCLKSETLAEYCGKQFIDIWADYSMINLGDLPF